ncbi:MAG: NADH-quinone oxidoreductase subunit J [Planctomycetes bacterium]|nr:NADH-quinone oxidoreductase subunit J [Planctomycetota bacterium]
MVATLAFWALALLTLTTALFVALARNVLHAAFALVFTLAGVAGLYFFLGADFLGAAQFLVYVGGVTVLMVFAVMFTPAVERGRFSDSTGNLSLGIISLLALFAVVFIFLWDANFGDRQAPEKEGSPIRIAAVAAAEPLGEDGAVLPSPHAEWLRAAAERARGKAAERASQDRARRVEGHRAARRIDAQRRALKRTLLAGNPADRLRLLRGNSGGLYEAPIKTLDWPALDDYALNVGADDAPAWVRLGEAERAPEALDRELIEQELMTPPAEPGAAAPEPSPRAQPLDAELARIDALPADDPDHFEPTTKALAENLLGKYVLPFELLSIVLLGVMVAAVVIVRKELKAEA